MTPAYVEVWAQSRTHEGEWVAGYHVRDGTLVEAWRTAALPRSVLDEDIPRTIRDGATVGWAIFGRTLFEWEVTYDGP